MRTRRWLTWVVFAVCALAVVEGLGWVTWQALRSEKRELQARADAEFQDSVRLALWRMESQATPIIAQESARPYFQYQSFYPAERAYNRMWQEVEQNEVLVPSPLLESSGQCIRLHFQIEPDGTITSPQAPTGNMLDLAESQYVDSEFIVLASQMLGQLPGMLNQASPDPDRKTSVKPGALNAIVPLPATQALPPQTQSLSNKDLEAGEKESEARQQAYIAANSQGDVTRRFRSDRGAPKAESMAGPVPASPRDETTKNGQERDKALPALKGFQSAGRAPSDVQQGMFEPAWRVNPSSGLDELFFQRTVQVQGVPRTQGFWMDWPALRARLLAAASDLLPRAELRPATQAPARSPVGALRLASIPVDLIPGPSPTLTVALVTAAHTTLLMTWLAVLGAVAAIAVVLRTSMELGDRRGRFVSAVTHELRTPLTTFCLYTEMLADGMVKDDRTRAEYLGTLKGESRRLAGIVENVLEYARLGGRRRPNGHSACTLEELLATVRPVLERSAAGSGLELLVSCQAPGSTRLAADLRTVERILLNLVENAGKYAAEAVDRRLHLEVLPSLTGQGISISVRDHGPGISRGETSRIFEAFHRARRDADGPKSGLGLGLALARGLARDMGGDLALVRVSGTGACFRLTIPAVDT